MFSIDGIEFDVGVSAFKRNFQVLDGENAGRSLDGDMVRDVIGAYYNYSVELDRRWLTEEQYDNLYEIISSPEEFHTIVVPYGQTTYTYQGYITNGSDELIIRNNKKYWNKLSFNMIAKSPKRRPS